MGSGGRLVAQCSVIISAGGKGSGIFDESTPVQTRQHLNPPGGKTSDIFGSPVTATSRLAHPNKPKVWTAFRRDSAAAGMPGALSKKAPRQMRHVFRENHGGCRRLSWMQALVIEFGSSPESPRKQSSLVLTEAMGEALPVLVADAHCRRAVAAPHCSAAGHGEAVGSGTCCRGAGPLSVFHSSCFTLQRKSDSSFLMGFSPHSRGPRLVTCGDCQHLTEA